MSALYLYALLEGASPAGIRGLRGEPVRGVRCGPLVAAVGRMQGPPPPEERWLRAHDSVVRALMEAKGGALPARFGGLVEDERALRAALAPRQSVLREAAALVRGCRQMTLRLWASGPPPAAAVAEDAGQGPGLRFLRRRARELSARDVPEAEALLEGLAGLARAERVQRHVPPLVASVYHLVTVEALPAYRRELRRRRRELRTLRVSSSGPSAPYAFAPDAVP